MAAVLKKYASAMRRHLVRVLIAAVLLPGAMLICGCEEAQSAGIASIESYLDAPGITQGENDTMDMLLDYATREMRIRVTFLAIIVVMLWLLLILLITFMVNNNKKRKIIAEFLQKAKDNWNAEVVTSTLTAKAMGIGLWTKEISAATKDGGYNFNADSPFKYSKEFRQLLGYTDENDYPELLSSWINCLHPDDKERAINDIQKHLNDYTGKTPYKAEYRLRTKSGEYRYYKASGETLRDEKGVPLRMAGAIKDITEEKRTAEKLDYNRKMLSAVNSAAGVLLNTDLLSFDDALYHSMKIIAETVGADRMYIWKNHMVGDELYCTQVYEWSEGALPQQGNEYTIDIPYSANVKGLDRLLMSGKCLNGIVRNMDSGYQAQLIPQGIVSILIVPVTLGDKFWGFVGFDDCHNERIFTEQEESILRSGSLLFAHAYHRNEVLQNLRDTSNQLQEAVNEAEKANKLKQDSINTMESILNSINVSIYATIPETGEILFVNNAMKKFFNMENEDLVGTRCYKVFRNLSEMCDFCPCYSLNEDPGKIITWEETFEDPEQHILHSDCYINWMDGRKVHLQTALDITELTLTKMAEEKYKAASDAKTHFLANMSHEIRTPMHVVVGMADLLLSENLNYRQHQYAQDIKTSANALLNIINDVLDFTKIQSAKLTLLPIHYSFKIFINNIISIVDYLIKDKAYEAKHDALTCRYKVDERIPEYIYGDDVRLRQIFLNLLSNAVKYSDTGTIELTAELRGTDMHVTVSDTGKGIPEEDLPNIFTAFERADESGNRYQQGTGLGLAITKTLIELMGGTICCESEYGKGTTFYFNIPVIEGDAALAAKEDKPDPVYAPSANILIVDDRELNVSVIHGLLEQCAIEADCALSGAEAIEKVKSNQYDLIFMDHMMPEMDGAEATALLREKGYDMPIIALTANAVSGSRELLLSSGMNDFLAKPIDKNELYRVLGQWLPADKIIRQLEKDEKPETAGDEKWAKQFRDEIEQIGEISTQAGLDMASGSINDYRNTLRILTREISSSVVALRRFMTNGDMKSFCTEVHGVKGSLALAGAMGLSAKARELENASRNGDSAFCGENLDAFTGRLAWLGNELSKVIERTDSIIDSSASGIESITPELRAVLDRLTGAMESKDFDEIFTQIDILGKMEIEGSLGEQVESLMTALQIMDYDTAGDIIRRLT